MKEARKIMVICRQDDKACKSSGYMYSLHLGISVELCIYSQFNSWKSEIETDGIIS